VSDREVGLLPGPRPLRSPSGAGPLAGRRVAVKDLFDVAGTVTGAGNPTFAAAARVATIDAPAVTRLANAGAVLYAKAITDEFAYSLDGDNAHYGAPHNARAPGRLPGGSSSGPAAAVAAGKVEIGLGSDTAGSVRVPASYCGLYGYRPTHGAIPTDGVVPLAPSFDTVSALTTDLELLELVGAVLRDEAVDALGSDEGAPSVFLIPEFLTDVVDDEVGARFREAIAGLGRSGRHGGYEVRGWAGGDGLTPPELGESYLTLSRIEAWAAHGQWAAKHWADLGPDVAERFRAAQHVDPDGAAVATARQHRARVRSALGELLDDGAVLILPAAANEPLPVDAAAGLRARSRQATIALCALAGLSGAPAVVVPVSPVDRPPIGVCIVARPGDDARAFAGARRLASTVEVISAGTAGVA
jgi:amidase